MASEQAPEPATAGRPLAVEAFRAHVTSHSGPIPSPEQLLAYGRVDPTLPHRIIEVWEGETAHRRALEERELSVAIASAVALQSMVVRGQRFGFVLGLVSIGAAIAIVSFVRTPVGAGSAGLTILGGLAALIWGPQRSAIGLAMRAADPRTQPTGPTTR